MRKNRLYRQSLELTLFLEVMKWCTLPLRLSKRSDFRQNLGIRFMIFVPFYLLL